MNVYQTLKDLGITLPEVATPAAAYLPYTIVDGWIYVSGHIAKKNGATWSGQLGKNMTTSEGKLAAQAVAVDLLGTLHAACVTQGKDLNQLTRIIKLLGLVNSTGDYIEHHLVVNGCSEFLIQALGKEVGAHARSAFGVAQLPTGACVEVELIARL
ncbi:MAG: RidA family protein [Gammaproteobacteria bacterium]|nr:RidA family protein [Gammaproteobacteria bacterium]